MLDQSQHDKLDGRLKRLSRSNLASQPYADAAAKVRRIIGQYAIPQDERDRGWPVPGRLVAHDWEQAWRHDRRHDNGLPFGMFGDIETDRVARDLHQVFKAMIRFVLDSDTARSKKQNAEQLSDRLADYLDRRGYCIAQGDRDEQKKEVPTDRRGKPGRKRDTDPKADKKIAEAWQTGRYKTHAELGKELGKSERDVKLALDRHRKRTPRRKNRAGK